jgi:hypothetical protein
MVTTLADAMFQTEQDLTDVQRLLGWICKIRDLRSNERPFVILRLYQRTGISRIATCKGRRLELEDECSVTVTYSAHETARSTLLRPACPACR